MTSKEEMKNFPVMKLKRGVRQRIDGRSGIKGREKAHMKVITRANNGKLVAYDNWTCNEKWRQELRELRSGIHFTSKNCSWGKIGLESFVSIICTECPVDFHHTGLRNWMKKNWSWHSFFRSPFFSWVILLLKLIDNAYKVIILQPEICAIDLPV